MSPGNLQRELRQRKPFVSTSHEAVVDIIRTADHVRRVLFRAIAPSGITSQQFNVLRILRGAGEDGLPTLEVADRMVEQTPGVTRLMDRLEAKGFIRRQRCPRDRRQHLCWITAAGRELLDQLEAPVRQAGDRCMQSLSEAERRSLIRLLDTVRQPPA
ncbi:MAG TPA: MarR family transcriptional regulator [Vicinamibacterales bacterium]|nr:MarR family transcriptional regulator [Vicinamibacterales bacterium]